MILAGGFASIFAREERKGLLFLLFFSTGSFLALVISLDSLFFSTFYCFSFNLPFPAGQVKLLFDPLSAFFISMIAVMGFLGVFYGNSYLKSYLNKDYGITSHYIFLGVFFSALILLPVIRNAFFFLIAWEFMSLSSFFLVLFDRKKKEVISAAINYLVTMHISVIFLILGFSILSFFSGSYDFSSFHNIFNNNRFLADAVFVILFIGFGFKAGLVPLHFWLPKAHPAAPSHISGLMSGLMIKIGIYGILRMLLIMGNLHIEIAYFVLAIGIITMLYGILNASVQNDIKKLLAYSSIENIGIITCGIGVGLLGIVYNNTLVAFLGFFGGLLHILNHSIFKELLFFGTGSVYTKAHTLNIDELGSLTKRMPTTSILFFTGVLAISGMPLLNGFISEFLIYMALLSGFKIHDLNIVIVFMISLASMALTGTMALMCFTKLFGIAFQGMPRSEKVKEVTTDVGMWMLLPKIALAAFIIIIGLLPNVMLLVFEPLIKSFVRAENFSQASFFTFNLLNIVSLVSIIFLSLIIIILAIRSFLLKNKKISLYKTWDCGYQAGNQKMQYTSYSFVGPFVEMFSNLFTKKENLNSPKTLFPSKGHFRVNIDDLLEVYFTEPIINGIKKILAKFIWIQNGSTQIYILYGFIFLILAIIGLFIYS
ncbi:MAG: hypothetical protein A2X47_03470 [Lentisphaerae bacterium GWF2_38_69]|nr:MAG: hypothetical protein A2X47_03470 [Lentisphaerae bacterium GWF2_38_69]